VDRRLGPPGGGVGAGRLEVPDEAAAPAIDDRAGRRRQDPVLLGHGGRGLRDNGPLRAFFEEEGIAYMLAVARDHAVATPTGPRRADILAAVGAWHRLSCGNGAKGRRW
jgi:hypothetical protein